MKILFIGDSITKGSVGVDWIKRLSVKHPQWTLNNAGADGETISQIGERLITILKKDKNYRLIVLQGGTNDLLIPALSSKGWLFKKATQYLIRKGYRPINDYRLFEKSLRLIIAKIRLQTNSAIILTTIACLNEHPETSVSEQRRLFNDTIRFVAHDTHCILADTGAAFDKYLAQRNPRNYLLSNFFSTTWTDKWNSQMGHADQLSRDRRLHLTVDGVHINSKGATIYREEIEKAIRVSMLYPVRVGNYEL